MYSKFDVSWLEVSLSQSQAVVRDHGRLAQLISELPRPDQQYPILSVFIGGKAKNTALQAIFPSNNIRRTCSHSGVGLRIETISAGTDDPILFADGVVEQVQKRPLEIMPGDRLLPCGSVEPTLEAIFSRLLFPFANIICIFGADFPNLASVARFLVDCAARGSTSNLPLAVRPKIIVVLEHNQEPFAIQQDIMEFYRLLNRSCPLRMYDHYSAINVIQVDPGLPKSIRHERLRTLIRDQQDVMQEVRRAYHCRFNGRHLQGLYESALKSFALGAQSHFDFANATREAFPVSPGLSQHLAHFLEAGSRGGCSMNTLITTVASALLMDHYVPGMMMLEPQMVFTAIYLTPVAQAFQAWHSRPSVGRNTANLVALVEQEFVRGFHLISCRSQPAAEFRKETLLALSYELGPVQSHTICLYCLTRSAQHCPQCHHSLCDNCAQIFGVPAANAEYRFTVSMCLLCLSRRDLVIDILPPTMNPSILAIDGGGVRGVIPLEFLILMQESLGPQCKLRDLIDLAVGPSSGGLITLGLIGMEWDVPMCSQIFDRLARRIFSERRESTLSWLAHLIFGPRSLLGNILQFLSWFCHDSCYDTRVFDASLREAFREDRRIFGSTGNKPTSYSNSKFGVIATNIAKETKSFVFGNFNVLDWFAGDQHEYEVFRPKADEELLFREAARATSAAPFFFSTANLSPQGSFQDGGLKDNFAADIARRLSWRIWPSRAGVARLISLGTGQVVSPPGHCPPFRNVFCDGFFPRSFGAFMSQMDSASRWLRMRNELGEAIRSDYLRLDVCLQNISSAIDNVDGMDEYRNLVIGQPGSNRMAREAATALLVARFYMELLGTPERVSGGDYILCYGMIRCKGPVRDIVEALEKQYEQKAAFASDTEHLAHFRGVEDVCAACGRYSKPVTLLLRHCDETLNISLRFGKQRRWKISGFPTTISSLVAAQFLGASFGSPDHGLPNVMPCTGCSGVRGISQGKRRRHNSNNLEGQASKRVCRVDQMEH